MKISLKLMGSYSFGSLQLKKAMKIILYILYIVPEDKLDQAEDYEIEEFNQFNKIEPALDFIKTKGADLSKFGVFKGNKPI